jgi:hypothetical protein
VHLGGIDDEARQLRRPRIQLGYCSQPAATLPVGETRGVAEGGSPAQRAGPRRAKANVPSARGRPEPPKSRSCLAATKKTAIRISCPGAYRIARCSRAGPNTRVGEFAQKLPKAHRPLLFRWRRLLLKVPTRPKPQAASSAGGAMNSGLVIVSRRMRSISVIAAASMRQPMASRIAAS